MRNGLAVILGVIVANVVFFLGSVAANRFTPTPPELMDPQTPEATALRVASAETTGLALVILAGALGGFAGGFIGARVAQGRRLAVTGAIGGLLSLWAAYSFYVFYPARLWFPGGLLVAFLASTYVGGFIAIKRKREGEKYPRRS